MSRTAGEGGAQGNWLAAALSSCRPSQVLREQGPLIVLVLAYIACAAIVSHHLGRGAEFRQLWGFYTNLFNLLLVGCGALTLAVCWCAMRVRKPLAFGEGNVLAAYAVPQRLIVGLPLLILLPGFLASMNALKIAIPAMNPYHWDALLAHWDQALHGGRHPWEWLQPLLGHPAITRAIDVLYHPGFFFGIYAVMFWQVFSLKNPALRMQFLLSFVLIWAVLGSIAATLLSSVGPCYYGDFVSGPDPYAGLMKYLRAAKPDIGVPWVTDVQQFLLDAHRQNTALGGVGISAMPSLHVAVTFLFALLGARTSRVLGVVLSMVAGITLLGSVHLAWHYALDGYVSIAGTWIIWRLVGRAIEARSARADAQASAGYAQDGDWVRATS